MTIDEAINVIHKTIYQFFDGDDGEIMSDKDKLLLAVNKAICNNIKALEHPEQNVIAVVPCGDAISRQEALKLFATHDGRYLYEAIMNLPSVTPKQRTGESEVNAALDKIKAELHATAELHVDGDYYLRDEWIDEIFDKYKAESKD